MPIVAGGTYHAVPAGEDTRSQHSDDDGGDGDEVEHQPPPLLPVQPPMPHVPADLADPALHREAEVSSWTRLLISALLLVYFICNTVIVNMVFLSYPPSYLVNVAPRVHHRTHAHAGICTHPAGALPASAASRACIGNVIITAQPVLVGRQGARWSRSLMHALPSLSGHTNTPAHSSAPGASTAAAPVTAVPRRVRSPRGDDTCTAYTNTSAHDASSPMLAELVFSPQSHSRMALLAVLEALSWSCLVFLVCVIILDHKEPEQAVIFRLLL